MLFPRARPNPTFLRPDHLAIAIQQLETYSVVRRHGDIKGAVLLDRRLPQSLFLTSGRVKSKHANRSWERRQAAFGSASG